MTLDNELITSWNGNEQIHEKSVYKELADFILPPESFKYYLLGNAKEKVIWGLLESIWLAFY